MKKTTVSIWVLALGMCATPVFGQVISTAAGTGWFFPTWSVPALSAPLGTLPGVAVDAQGNVYASDSANEIVVRISPTGLRVSMDESPMLTVENCQKLGISQGCG